MQQKSYASEGVEGVDEANMLLLFWFQYYEEQLCIYSIMSNHIWSLSLKAEGLISMNTIVCPQ